VPAPRKPLKSGSSLSAAHDRTVTMDQAAPVAPDAYFTVISKSAQSKSATLEIDLSQLPISRQAALALLSSPDQDLPTLLAAARAAKEKFKPGVITYSRKVFIPLTNLCRDYCGYCTFRRDPLDPGAHTMTPDEVLAVVRAGEELGCTEALFSLGDKPELLFPEMRDTLRRLGYNSTLQYLAKMCELVLRETSLLPHPNPGLLSPEWLRRLAGFSPSMGLMLETTSETLIGSSAAHDNACAQSRKLANLAFPSLPAC